MVNTKPIWKTRYKQLNIVYKISFKFYYLKCGTVWISQPDLAFNKIMKILANLILVKYVCVPSTIASGRTTHYEVLE